MGKRIFTLFALLLVIAGMFTGCAEMEKLFTQLTDTQSKVDYNNTVTALDVGQAACTLIESDGHFCLIDAGSAGGTVDVSSYLKKRKVKKIDLLVLSHFHYDHTSEVLDIIRNFDIETVLIPALDENNIPDSYLYKSLQEDSEQGYYSLEYAEKDKTFTVGGGTVRVLADTYNLDPDLDANNTSVALSYTKGDFVYVNTADIEQRVEREYLVDFLPENITVYAAAHHGSQYSNTAQILEKLSPDFITVSCGKDNDYGHPHRPFLDRVNAIGAEYLVTAEYGNIVYSMEQFKVISEQK